MAWWLMAKHLLLYPSWIIEKIQRVPALQLCGGIGGVAAFLYILFGGDTQNSRSSRRKSLNHRGAAPPGLANLGQTCFMNALLQALASCESYVEWLEENGTNHRDSRQLRFHRTMLQAMRVLNNRTTNNSIPAVLTELLDAVRMQGWVVENTEHDAHELFQGIINMLQTQVKEQMTGFSVSDEQSQGDGQVPRNDIMHRSMVQVPRLVINRFPLLGRSASSMTCRSCLTKRIIHYDTFTSLSLPFPPHSKGVCRLDDLLSYYFTSENLNEVDCEACSKHHNTLMKRTFLKQVSIGKLPRCLCLHIQRLSWHQVNTPIKRHDNVIFPAIIDLENFTQTSKALAFSEQVHQRPESNDHHKGSRWYHLVAVIEHRGSESAGHFVTYRKYDYEANLWSYTSDMEVTQVTCQQVHARIPYMLFYERMR